MDAKGLMLLFVCIAIGFYLNLQWLTWLLVLFLFLVVLGSASAEKKPTPRTAPEEIIYPVIYEDVGEPPWLYHPKTKIEVKPDWTPMPIWSVAAGGMASLFKIALKLGGAGGKEDKETKEDRKDKGSRGKK